MKKTTAVKAIPIPRSRKPNGKPAAKKKLSLKSAIVAVAVFSALIIIWQWNRSPATAPATPAGVQTGTPASVATAGVETATSGVPAPAAETSTSTGPWTTKSATGAEGTGLIIADVRISPAQPVATDPITAVVSLAGGGDATGITFTYQWKRNDQIIPEATTNILKDTPLNRRDRISVVATAFRDGVAGPPAKSQIVLIYSMPLTLEMKILTPQIRLGQPFEIQLITAAPAGDKVVYSLISPFLEEMTIDGNTGKIIWTPKRVLKGKLLFGASVADTDGSTTTKVFELDMGIEQGP